MIAAKGGDVLHFCWPSCKTRKERKA